MAPHAKEPPMIPFTTKRLATLALLASSTTAVGCGSGSDTHASSGTSGGHGPPGDGALALPQFVHGAARVDTAAFPSIPIVVTAEGEAPASVTVTVDGAAVDTVKEGERF